MESTPEAMERIHATFRRVLSDGLRQDAVSGASGEQIAGLAAAQSVTNLPGALHQVYHLIGARSALWLAGSPFGTALDGRAAKSRALATLARLGDPFADASAMYVLVAYGERTFHVIDGPDLSTDDPPVWLISEDEAVIRGWDAVSEWFSAMAPDVGLYRERLHLMRQSGDPAPPWARHLTGA
ncbi:hypothetical protein [Actinomadura alba]|uniref:SMI1/KNR4 family protein n=1 Tax=Actinomadura alba TaxID=406431 RepID=A0ABR7LZA6_9ACTN|nr:hypothetical protein [Actinomadura alba]MBC6469708.1 hypothetical protein [Actinomadura alba]